MDKNLTKLIVSLVLGCIISVILYLIVPVSNMLAMIAIIAMCVVIYLISGAWIRQKMPGAIGIIGSIVCPIVAGTLLTSFIIPFGGSLMYRLAHMIGCAAVVYAADRKFGKK